MLLKPGETCWRIAKANRFRVIIDAEEYFRTVKQAMLLARHSLLLLGWDFDTRVEFEPEETTIEGPGMLGDFLKWLSSTRDQLDIHVLKWDLGGVHSLGRKQLPFVVKNALTDRHLHLRLDGAHPPGSAHHSKIVVIDDSLAFCGGIDMTMSRWDTRRHIDDDPRRVEPNGAPYKAWHDATTLISGPAAAVLGDLARDRWKRATGRDIPPPPEPDELWPEGLEPNFENVEVGVARTAPAHNGEDEIREIEALYLAAIAQAKKTIYVESQYLASRRIALALADRLREPDGPEVILVLPENAEGWLQRKPMDGARKKLLHQLWRADEHRRLGAYYPVTTGGNWIYVHAKIMIVDDEILRVGSSNLNNRSMGFDTECDVIVETARHVPHHRPLITRRIRAIRDDLVSEHLDVSRKTLDTALSESQGSLLTAIETLRGTGKTLMSFDPGQVADEDSVLAENELADPEHANSGFLQRFSKGLQSIFF